MSEKGSGWTAPGKKGSGSEVSPRFSCRRKKKESGSISKNGVPGKNVSDLISLLWINEAVSLRLELRGFECRAMEMTWPYFLSPTPLQLLRGPQQGNFMKKRMKNVATVVALLGVGCAHTANSVRTESEPPLIRIGLLADTQLTKKGSGSFTRGRRPSSGPDAGGTLRQCLHLRTKAFAA